MATALRELRSTLRSAWHNVADGWRELVDRASSALTQFVPTKNTAHGAESRAVSFPRWGVLAGEVIEKPKSLVVQLELPGIDREDCEIVLENGALHVRGEKRMDREHIGNSYYVMERAYGSFHRVIPLPEEVDADSARASMKNGVLKIELEKKPVSSRRRVTVH